MITTITGANSFAAKAEIDRILQDFVATHTDMAVERFDGEETSFERMRESVQSLPFLSVRKLVLLREPSKQKAFAEQISDVLTSAADSTDLVILEPKLDKRSSYYKTLKKQTDYQEFGELDARALATWAANYVKQRQGSLSTGDAAHIIDRIGASQQLLKSELDKLLAYDQAITRTTIELLVEPLPQSTIFSLIEAAFAGRAERALELYKEQRALKVEPQQIIAMLAWQLHVLAVVKAAGGRNSQDIAKEAKLNPYVVNKVQTVARGLSLPVLKQHIKTLLEIDTESKTSSINTSEAVQLFILQLR